MDTNELPPLATLLQLELHAYLAHLPIPGRASIYRTREELR